MSLLNTAGDVHCHYFEKSSNGSVNIGDFTGMYYSFDRRETHAAVLISFIHQITIGGR